MQLIHQGWLDRHSVGELASRLGVAERHLRRLMIDAVGAPPLSIARAHRAQIARTLIETTDMRFADVAFASGFSSLRQFNDTVRAVFDSTPTELRRRGKGSPTSGGPLRLRLAYRSPIAAEHLFRWWGLRSVPGVAVGDSSVLHTALRLPRGLGVATLRPAEQWIDCELDLEATADLAPAVAQCRALLDLDADPLEVDQAIAGLESLAPYVASLPGLRSPGSADGFATVIFAVLGQQRSVAAARTIAGRIVARARHGTDVDGAIPGGEAGDRDAGVPTLSVDDDVHEVLGPFPTAREIADLDLSDIGLNGRAVDTIHAIAAQFTDRETELGPGGDSHDVLRELLAVKGIGPWTADYLAMRVFADPDVLLRGDLIVDRAAASLGLDAESFESVRPWRSYLTHHLWAASASLKGRP